MTKHEWKRLRKLAGFTTQKSVADHLCRWPNMVHHKEKVNDGLYRSWLVCEAALRQGVSKKEIMQTIKGDLTKNPACGAGSCR